MPVATKIIISYYTHKRGTSTAGPKIGTKARASISAAIHNYLGRQFVCENHALSWAWLTYYDRQCTVHRTKEPPRRRVMTCVTILLVIMR